MIVPTMQETGTFCHPGAVLQHRAGTTTATRASAITSRGNAHGAKNSPSREIEIFERVDDSPPS